MRVYRRRGNNKPILVGRKHDSREDSNAPSMIQAKIISHWAQPAGSTYPGHSAQEYTSNAYS